MIYATILYLYRIIQLATSTELSASTQDILLLLSGIIIVIISVPGTIVLLGQELWGIVNNMTRIELWEKHWATRDLADKGQDYVYPYDQGSYSANLYEFFGSSLFLWPFPIIPSGDGVSYPPLIPKYQWTYFVRAEDSSTV
jgi:hypothetical protein